MFFFFPFFFYFVPLFVQERVHHYTSELGIAKGHTDKYKEKLRKHVFDVTAYGDFDYCLLYTSPSPRD